MREFPGKIIPSNLEQFASFRYERGLLYFREAVYEHLLQFDSKSEFTEYFSVDEFMKLRRISNDEIIQMLKVIQPELMKVGWDSKVGHSNTALWMWPANTKAPANLPDW